MGGAEGQASPAAGKKCKFSRTLSSYASVPALHLMRASVGRTRHAPVCSTSERANELKARLITRLQPIVGNATAHGSAPSICHAMCHESPSFAAQPLSSLHWETKHCRGRRCNRRITTNAITVPPTRPIQSYFIHLTTWWQLETGYSRLLDTGGSPNLLSQARAAVATDQVPLTVRNPHPRAPLSLLYCNDQDSPSPADKWTPRRQA